MLRLYYRHPSALGCAPDVATGAGVGAGRAAVVAPVAGTGDGVGAGCGAAQGVAVGANAAYDDEMLRPLKGATGVRGAG